MDSSPNDNTTASKIVVIVLLAIIVAGVGVWVLMDVRVPARNKNVAKQFTASLEKECLREQASEWCQRRIAERHRDCFEESVSPDAEDGYDYDVYRDCVMAE